MFKKRDFYIQRSKSFKIYPKVSKIEVEIPKTQEKTLNSRKKLKLWEDFAPSERPSDVIKKACHRESVFQSLLSKHNRSHGAKEHERLC